MAEDAGGDSKVVVPSMTVQWAQAWQEGKDRQEEADGLKKLGGLERFMFMRMGNRFGKSGLLGRTDVCG